MKKYLYGKFEHLEPLARGAKGIRFSDIIHYSDMDNDLMRDHEIEKTFLLDKDSFKWKLGDLELTAKDFSSHPSISVSVNRCFCLCLSSKKNDPELFERFNADVCIELDVHELLAVLALVTQKFKGMQVVHREVNYYPEIMKSAGPDLASILFYKRDKYAVEAEYRIALTVPGHITEWRTLDGKSFPIFQQEASHIFINGPYTKRYVKGFYQH